MDDDDFYGPEHVWDLVVARLYSGAEIVGKVRQANLSLLDGTAE
jgi:hypothetical protein